MKREPTHDEIVDAAWGNVAVDKPDVTREEADRVIRRQRAERMTEKEGEDLKQFIDNLTKFLGK